MKEVMEEGRLLDDDTDLDLDSHMIKGHSVDLQLHNRSTSIKLILYIELVHIILFLLAICLWYTISNLNPAPHTTSITSYARLSRQSSTITFPEDEASFLNTTLPTPEADSFWINLTVGNNGGLVSLPSAFINYYNLPATYLPTNPDENVYHLDVFHQLHCLFMIRSHIVAPLRNETTNATFDNTNPLSDLPFKHTLHCIDYLRRVLMCHGDLTLMDTNTDPGFKGYRPRQCTDWEALREWVGENAWDLQRFDTRYRHNDITQRLTR